MIRIIVNLVILSVWSSITFIHSSEEECPEIYPLKQLSLSKILGTWYVASEYPAETPENCVRLRIVKGNDTMLKFYSTEFSVEHGWLNREKVIATLPHAPVAYFDLQTFDNEIHDFIPYSIIGTDYKSYATFYACYTGNMTMWVVTREQNATDDIISKGVKAMKRKGLDLNMTKKATFCEDWTL